MSADPLAEEYIDISAYTYCHNNPINLFDPDGQGDYYTDAVNGLVVMETG